MNGKRRTIFLRPAVLLAVLLGLPLGGASAAERDPALPEFTRLEAGFGGQYKVGVWTPVRITLHGGTTPFRGHVTLAVPDGDGAPTLVATPPDRPCQVLPGRDTTVLLYARFGRTDGEAAVEFVADGKVRARDVFSTYTSASDRRLPVAMDASQRWFLEIGAKDSGVKDAVKRLASETADAPPVVSRIQAVEDLPTRWIGYEGVEAVVISTSQPELFRKLGAGRDARLEALEQWVRLGGRLVLTVGAQGAAVLDEQGPLARFAPGKLKEMFPLRRTSALESYADSKVSVPDLGEAMLVPRLASVEGTVEAAESDLPLIVRTQRGFGQIVFAATDLDRAPWARWHDRPALVARLLNLPAKSARDEETAAGGALMGEGYADVAGQLRSCLDRFVGVRPVSFGAVVAGVLFYILLIGPGDYFILRKLRRMEWTWFTFPAIVVVFCVGTYCLAYWLKGGQLRVNQVDVVDVDTQSGLVRGTTWANLFSPRMETYTLTLRPALIAETAGQQDQDTPADEAGANNANTNGPSVNGPASDQPEVLFAWMGLPGSGLGGMQSRGGSMGWRRPYAFSPSLDTMVDCPIQVWSTKSLTGRYWFHWSECPKADLRQENEQPAGRLTNTLPFALERCLLVYDRWAYDFGTLAPGESVSVERAGDRVNLKTLLTGRTLVSDPDSKQIEKTTPFNVSSNDTDYVLRQMMFFEAAGGRKYARLSNGYQSFVDLSDALGPDRAILVAHAPRGKGSATHGAALMRDGQPLEGPEFQHTTVFRFLFPVKTTSPQAPERSPGTSP